MTLTLKGLSKNGRAAFYVGAITTLRISIAAFPGKTAPQIIEVADGAFAPAKPPRVRMTKEERKAFNANRPKPTLAEKAAKAREKADALAAALAAEQPSL